MTATARIAPTGTVYGLRRAALFLSMLVSGGLPLFPREAIVMLIIVLCLAITGLRLPPRRQMWPLFMLLVAVLFVTLVRPGPTSVSSLFSRFAIYIAAVLMLQVYLRAPAGSLVADMKALLWPMVLQAIATVVLAHAANFLFMPISLGEAKYQTLLLIFTYHTTVEGLSSVIRPDGFFFEPGVFQIYLNLYLYLALFSIRRPAPIALATLAVFATQSTTGLLICLILLGTALAQRLSGGTLRHRAGAVALAMALAPPLLYIGYDNISDKLFGGAQGSSWAREYDFYTGLNIAAEHPWLGIGFEVQRYVAESGRVGFEDTQLNASLIDDRPTSNGLVQLFYSLGFPLALTFMVGIFRQRLFRHCGLIGLWLCLSLFSEALMFTPFFLFIIFSAFLVRPAARLAKPRPAARLAAHEATA